jgi:hypothetical protein
MSHVQLCAGLPLAEWVDRERILAPGGAAGVTARGIGEAFAVVAESRIPHLRYVVVRR